jgi:hypothetical protein
VRNRPSKAIMLESIIGYRSPVGSQMAMWLRDIINRSWFRFASFRLNLSSASYQHFAFPIGQSK